MVGDIAFRILRSSSTFGAIASDRIYPLVAPENTTLPCAVVTQTGDQVGRSHDGDDLHQGSLQIGCMAQTYADARALGSAAISAIVNYHGSAGGRAVQTAYVSDDRFDYIPDDIKERRLFVRVIDFTIWHKEL